jgi:23S rRNA (adenine2503-C2)-methyltransferase
MSGVAHAKRFSPGADTVDGRASLIGLSYDELAAELAALGAPAFGARQLWHWIYRRGETDLTRMTTLGEALRARLNERFAVRRPEITADRRSRDGTYKWLLRFADGQEVETVYIPEDDRGTLCVSSQVGCTLTCRFCHTGTQRLVRNLSASEIVNQVMLARDALGEWPASNGGRSISNIVMMGMGEPLYNYENVAKALRIFMDRNGLGMSRRKITLSTAGVVPMIRRCGEELGVNLAVSLHAVSNDVRDQIVPLNKRYPLEELLSACRDYPGVHRERRITFEYVMLKGINDSQADAHQLVRSIRDIPAKVNLIPFNTWPGAPFTASSKAATARFAAVLAAAGIPAPVRTPRGQDIMAACGQLRSASQRLRSAERQASKQGGELAAAG